MKKLWQKNWELDPLIETFETKGDLGLDQKLVKYDIFGSLAHAAGLAKIGIISSEELKLIQQGLAEILTLERQGNFNLQPDDEDVHTKIENFLTDRYGEIGKKIHTGRSRNDQVLTAIRLFTKDRLLKVWAQLLNLIEILLDFAQKYKGVLMPGYTHMQKAMPATIGLWASAIASGLLDDLTLLKATYRLNNQSPLGSAAGYGVPLPLDREYTAKLLGFAVVQINSLSCQNSRGKIEAAILAALISILADINKLASDILIFTTSEFNFLRVAEELCSGSSIMPQKRNLDPAELLRSKVHLVLGNYVQIVSLTTNLMSGYHRDLQDTKKPLFESLESVKDCLKVSQVLVKGISLNQKVLRGSLTPEILSTHRALNLVKQGVPFREAYQQVAAGRSGPIPTKKLLLEEPTHLGGIGNLGIDLLTKLAKTEQKTFQTEKKNDLIIIHKLLAKEGKHHATQN